MVRKIATALLIAETMIIVILTTLLLTPKDTLIKISNVLTLKYKIVLVEN